MKANQLLLLTGVCAVALPACNQKKEGSSVSEKPMNILYIMCDDHSFQTISAYDNRFIQTPNIDRIAKEGVRFTNSFVANSLSGPSRACLLTGKHSHKNGFTDNTKRFDGSQQTFPKLLQKAGYQTAIVGKWHLTSEPTGFDYWNILIGQGDYYNPYFIENGEKKQIEGYATNITTDLAIGLKADLDVAEQVKVEHAVASPKLRRGNESHVAIRVGSGQSQRRLEFDTELVDDIVEARLSELFELINRELKRIKRQANLPGGAVLTGGGANLRGIVDYARVALQMNARVYKPQNYKGVTEQIRDAGWTTALGLLEYSAESGIDMGNGSGAEHRGIIGGLIAKIGGLFNRKSN